MVLQRRSPEGGRDQQETIPARVWYLSEAAVPSYFQNKDS